MKRAKTNYPGVFYREAERIGGNGTEKVYYIVFKKDGKVIEEKVGRQFVDDMTPSRAAGIRAERVEGRRLSRKEIKDQQKAQEQAEKDAEANRWTIDKLWKEYQKQKGDYRTLKTDTTNYNRYLDAPFGQREPRDIIQMDVDRLRIKLLKSKSPQTVKHVLVLLKRIANFGVKKGLSAGLQFTIEMPRLNNEKTEDLTPDELSRLLEAIDKADSLQAANLMRMALFSGMRRGELFRLQWADLDFERGFIHLRDTKGGKDQTIPMNAEAHKILEGHERTASPFVFPGRKGKKRVDIHKTVNRIKEAAGLPKNFRAVHGLRHVYASMLASSGRVDMYTLQKLLTHKSPQMTQRYAHLRDESLRAASELAGSIIQAANGKKDNVVSLKDHA
ncbi:MAG: site-specific integrase [Syntrophobacteraceae bacterium]|jgi:integrase